MSKFNLGGIETPVQMTPLADASARGRLEIVQVLVENKAEVNALSEVSLISCYYVSFSYFFCHLLSICRMPFPPLHLLFLEDIPM